MRTGIDVLCSQRFEPLRGRKITLHTNEAAVDATLRATSHILQDHLTLVDWPEADTLVWDTQDIGATNDELPTKLMHLLDDAHTQKKSIMVLDRPNPLGGIVVFGLPPKPSLAAGPPIPVRHGMTTGELANMLNEQFRDHPADLTVIPCEGWERHMLWSQTGLEWVPPSPLFPAIESVKHYPGSRLLAGTNLSAGLGTAQPYQLVGAPWMNGEDLADHIVQAVDAGVIFRPHRFEPTGAHRYTGEVCEGLQVHISAEADYQPLKVWLTIIEAVASLYPDLFEWAGDGPVYAFDRLVGTTTVREQIDTDSFNMEATFREWANASRDFEVERQKHLLYE